MSRRRAVTNWAYAKVFLSNVERVARSLRHAPPIRPERRGLQVTHNVRYGPGPMHHLDVYRPRQANSTARLPVLVYVHGGGFRFFDKDTHWAIAARFSRHGYLVFNVDYRLAPKEPYPAAVEDVAEALRWIARHAPAMGGDLGRLALAGESAGANLVTGLAISSAWRRPEPWAQKVWELNLRPRVLLPACGYLGVSYPERHAATVHVPEWMQGRIHTVSDLYLPGHTPPRPEHAYANPILMLEAADAPERPFPATFALSGDKDPVRTDTDRLGAALARLEVPHQTERYEGGVHTFHALMRTALAQRAWADQLAFLDRHIKAPRSSSPRRLPVAGSTAAPQTRAGRAASA